MIALDAGHVTRHHVTHELLRLLVHVVSVDQDFADVGLEVIADGTNHQAGFLINQEGAGLRFGSTIDRVPQLQQVVEIPLQFFSIAADACRAGDQTHATGHVQLIHDLAKFLAIFTFDATRNTAATGIVRHQHQIAASQRDVSRQRRALVAALFLFNLNNDFLANLQGFFDGRLAGIDTWLEIVAGNFLERQKAMTLAAVIDESGFQTGLKAGNDRLVDVALALLFGG